MDQNIHKGLRSQDIAFVSTAFGVRYVEQLDRLRASVNLIYPDSNFIYWEERLPPGSKPFSDSLYGFKPHCVQYAKEAGFKKIIFLDPACILVEKVDYWFDIIDRYGLIAAMDDNLLSNYCGNAAFKYFNASRETALYEKWHLVGGSVYVFDFDFELCHTIFNKWMKAEKDGMYGSQVQQARGEIETHRNDESCMSLSLYTSGSSPTPYDVCRYDKVPNPVVIKKHFK